MKYLKYLFILFALSLIIPQTGYTAYEEENSYGYDAIVSSLKSKRSVATFESETDLLDNVFFHGSIGYANTAFGIEGDGFAKQTITKQGVQLSFGIDIFDPTWVAEGSFINFPERSSEKSTSALKEFDLKVYRKMRLTYNFWAVRIGAGIASRYLKIQTNNKAKSEYSTPSSIVFGALEAEISNRVSLVTEMAYKTPWIADTPEKSALDLIFRLDSTF